VKGSIHRRLSRQCPLTLCSPIMTGCCPNPTYQRCNVSRRSLTLGSTPLPWGGGLSEPQHGLRGVWNAPKSLIAVTGQAQKSVLAVALHRLGLPKATMRRKVALKELRTNLVAAWKTTSPWEWNDLGNRLMIIESPPQRSADL
jgi:hypothetical protein